MPSVGVIPALSLIVGAVIGILAGTESGILRACLPMLLVTAGLCWQRGHSRAVVILVACGFAVGGAVLGAAAVVRSSRTELRSLLHERFGGFDLATLGPPGDHEPIETRLTLLEDAAVTPPSVALSASVSALCLDGRWRQVGKNGVRITVNGTSSPRTVAGWRGGRAYRMPVVFRRPARYLDAGVADFERDLAFDGVTLFGTVKSGRLVIEEQRGTWTSEWAASARAFVRRVVATHVSARDPVAGAIVVAVLIGDRTAISDDLRDRLQAAGTYHVIAISGGNIAVLTGLVLAAFSCVGLRGRLAALGTIAVLVAYASGVVTGPSVWRATAVAIAYLVATLGDHRTPPWQAMALAASLMVAIDPLEVRNPGFVLTFGASAALLEIARRVAPVLSERRVSMLGAVVSSVAASAAVELALLPVAAQAFSRVSIAGLLLNLFAVPAMVVLQMAGMVVVALSFSSVLADLAGSVAIWSAWTLIETARLVEVFPGLSQRVPPPGFVVIGIYYSALLMVVWCGARWRRVAVGALAASLIVIVWGPVSRWMPTRQGRHLQLTVLDVGQAESLLLRVPDGRTLMVDTGGSAFGGFDIGGRVLAPALWASGLYSLDGLLITHGDPDHIGGAIQVVEDFAPELLWTGVPMPAHAPSLALGEMARRHGSTPRSLRRGQTWKWGRATFRVLHPPEPDWERRRVRNDDSVVIEVVLGEVAMLLTGDIGADIEREILPMLTHAPIRILKVAHHGSRTSSSPELIERWRPTIALISCGRGNQFGHPVSEVLERLANVNARIYRTDRDGQITVTTDGAGVEVETYTGGRR